MSSFFIKRTNSAKLALSLIAVAALAACGGGDTAPVAQIPVGSVIVSDPYAVCTSVTMGGVAAIAAKTAAGVTYYRPALNAAGLPVTGPVIATGCKDQTTNANLSDMRSSGTTVAAGTLEIVSPVTTLIEQFITNALPANPTPAQVTAAKTAAETRVAQFLGLPAADLYKDPVATPTVLQATAKLTATIELLKAAGATGTSNALNNMAAEIAKPAAIATLNAALINPAFLTAVSVPAGSTTSTLSPTQIALVSVVATNVIASITPTSNLAQIASVVASVSSTTAGSGSIGDVVKAAAASPTLSETTIAATSTTVATKAAAVVANPTVTAPAVVVPPVILITGGSN